MRVLIVDGYNVIRSTRAYARLQSDEWEVAREALIADVAAFAQGDYDRAVVVFDGAGNPHSEGKSQQVAGIEVLFSKHGASADSVIEKLSRDARERGDDVLVVSSDATIQWTTMGGSVTRMSAAGFVEEGTYEDEDRANNRTIGNQKSPLAERLSNDAISKLERLRDDLGD